MQSVDLAQRIWVIVGTRPEVIKQVPLFWSLCKDFGRENVALVGTGQHRELLDQALEHFDCVLDYNLSLVRSSRSLTQLSSQILAKFGELVSSQRPRGVVVQGDTSSAAMVAISCFYEDIPVFHNEAGLRSHDLQNPFPEEANRKWISDVADLHFAPTQRAEEVLRSEGVSPKRVYVTGNTGVDSLLWTLENKKTEGQLDSIQKYLDRRLKPVLVTAHRRENDGESMGTWYETLLEYLEQDESCFFVLPLHPNNLAKPHAERYMSGHSRAYLCSPLNYAQTCHLLQSCHFVVTDSGGIQEESATLNIPAVVCRKTTERYEGVDHGISKLVDPSQNRQLFQAMRWASQLDRSQTSGKMPYGDGDASPRISRAIKNFFGIVE